MNICVYTKEGPSNLVSAGKHAFTYGSWEIWGTLMSFTTFLFRKEISQILDAFILALDIVGLNILDSVIYRAKEYHWKYTTFLSASRWSWRRTAVLLRLYLFIAKRDTRQKLGTSDKLRLRWCLRFQFNKKLTMKKGIFLLIVPRETLSCFVGRSENCIHTYICMYVCWVCRRFVRIEI